MAQSNQRIGRILTRFAEDLGESLGMDIQVTVRSQGRQQQQAPMVQSDDSEEADADYEDDDSPRAVSDGHPTNGQGRVTDPTHDRRLKENQGRQPQGQRRQPQQA